MPVLLLVAAAFLILTMGKTASAAPAPAPTRPPSRPPTPPRATPTKPPAQRPLPSPVRTPKAPPATRPPTTSSQRPPKPAPWPKYSGTLKKSDLTSFNVLNRVVQQTPAMIQADVSYKLGRKIPMAVIAMATMIASEASRKDSAKIGVAWAAMNYMIRTKKGLVPILMPDGRFASQNVKGHGYASTAQPPSKRDIQLAEQIIAKKIPDPTHGSIQFDSPKAQRQLVARGAAGYKNSPEAVAAQRRKEGKVEVHLADISPDDLRFWRPVA